MQRLTAARCLDGHVTTGILVAGLAGFDDIVSDLMLLKLRVSRAVHLLESETV
jgi:hypothetical protein